MRAVYISGAEVSPLLTEGAGIGGAVPGWAPGGAVSQGVGGGVGAGSVSDASGVDFSMADGNATDVVMRARVPRVIVPRSACRGPRFSWEHLLRLLDCCPGAGACEYLQRLHAEITAAASPGLLGSVLWKQRQRWAGADRSGYDLLNELLAEQREWEEEREAAERGIQGDGPEGGGGLRGGASLAALRSSSGIPLCDVTSMLAFLEPSVMRGYQVVGGLERAGWGLREGGAGGGRGLLLGPEGLTPLLQDALPQGAWRPGDNPPDSRAVLGPSRGLPAGSDGLRGPGVAVLAHAPVSEAMNLEVAGLCAQLHGQPYLEMTGAYDDAGMLNPYILYPVMAIAVPAVVLAVACCVAVLRLTGCCGVAACAPSRLVKAAGGAAGKEY